MTNNEAGTPLELWDDARINQRINEVLVNYHTPRGLARRVSYGVRDEYQAKIAELEAARAADALRVADLEAKLIVVSKELTSTSNADRYYRGHNDGYDLGYSRGLEAQRRTQPGGEGDNADG